MQMQKVLVTGGRGQLGTAVTRCLVDDFDCVAKSSAEFDLTKAEHCIARLDEIMPRRGCELRGVYGSR